jgi:hypothetical protein
VCQQAFSKRGSAEKNDGSLPNQEIPWDEPCVCNRNTAVVLRPVATTRWKTWGGSVYCSLALNHWENCINRKSCHFQAHIKWHKCWSWGFYVLRGCIQKFPDWVDTLAFGITRWEATLRIMAAKLTRLTQNSDTTAPSGKELYHLQISLQAASPETFEYSLVLRCDSRVAVCQTQLLCRSLAYV